MRNLIGKCLAMGFIAALFSSNPALAGMTGTEAKLAIIASKLAKLDAAMASGQCVKCAVGIAVAQADVEKLGMSDLRKDDRAKLGALVSKIKAMSAKLDAVNAKIVALGKRGGGLNNNAALVGLTGINGVFGTGVVVTSVVDGKIEVAGGDGDSEDAEDEDTVVVKIGGIACPTGFYADADMSYRQSGRHLHARKHVKCLPASVLAPLPPVVSSSRTTAGWVLSTLGGAATLGVAGWWIANKASPVVVTDGGVDGGMGPPVAFLGAVIGAGVGALVYGWATSE